MARRAAGLGSDESASKVNVALKRLQTSNRISRSLMRVTYEKPHAPRFLFQLHAFSSSATSVAAASARSRNLGVAEPSEWVCRDLVDTPLLEDLTRGYLITSSKKDRKGTRLRAVRLVVTPSRPPSGASWVTATAASGKT